MFCLIDLPKIDFKNTVNLNGTFMAYVHLGHLCIEYPRNILNEHTAKKDSLSM